MKIIVIGPNGTALAVASEPGDLPDPIEMRPRTSLARVRFAGMSRDIPVFELPRDVCEGCLAAIPPGRAGRRCTACGGKSRRL